MFIQKKPLSLFEALTPLIMFIALLASNIYLFGHDVLHGANQWALIFSGAFAGGIACIRGQKWSDIEQKIGKSMSEIMPAILLLFMIGALSGTWLLAGIIPAMIYYALQFLHPTYFLVLSCLICAILSLSIGSSWSTIATIGMVLVGVGKILSISTGMIAGAVISGAYFGNKLSPLSDTVILATNVAKVPISHHIQYALKTSIPSFIITLVLFFILGLFIHPTIEMSHLTAISAILNNAFYISPFLFLVPLLVIFLLIKRIPAFPVLLIGTLVGGIVAFFFQTDTLAQLDQTIPINFAERYKKVLQSVFTTVHITTGHTLLDSLLISHGMAGMLDTIWLILASTFFSGMMEATGILALIMDYIVRIIHSASALIIATVLSAVFFNLVTSEQYMAILMPGKMYRSLYEKKGIALKNLSRVLGDSATITSPLIPWNTCGAVQSAMLGVPTLTYLPYCFLNLINPLIAIFFGYFPKYIAVSAVTCKENQK